MDWQMYRVVLQMRSPLHIGWNRVGNLQRTRPYVTGRVLWGALTHRLGRDAYRQNPATDTFVETSNRVTESLAFTYFYPAIAEAEELTVQWPWIDQRRFAYHFLRSYPSTALAYPQRAAAEGTLHEVEFVSPRMVASDNRPVYLWGYVFAREDAPDGWQAALARVQFGGERGYGWGDVALVSAEAENEDHRLFQRDDVTVSLSHARPQLRLEPRTPLLAHTRVTNLAARGQMEPFLGREQPRRQPGHAGQHVRFEAVCFAPGSQVTSATTVAITGNGIWEAVAG